MNKELQTGTDKPKSSCWNAKQPTLACTQVWSRTASRKSSTSLPAGSSWQTENSRPELASKSSRVNATECHTHPDGSCGSSRNGSIPDSRRKAFSSCSESSACATAKERCPHPWDPAMQCRVDLEPSITLHGPAQGLSSTESTDNVGATGHVGSIPGWGRTPQGGHDSPLQYSCLENLTARGDLRVTAHGVA